MADIKLYTATAVIGVFTQKPAQGLILVTLVVIVLYKVTRPQVDLDTDQDRPTVTLDDDDDDDQSPEPPSPVPSFTRPTLIRRNCLVLGPNGLTSQPLSPEWEYYSESSSDSEAGYETTHEDSAPTCTMADTRALAYFEERARLHRESVSSQVGANLAVKTVLTNTQTKGHPAGAEEEDEDDAEALRRRNIKMRDQGVRVAVAYSQLASLRPLQAPTTTTTTTSPAGSPPRAAEGATSTTPLSSPSPPRSGLISPAPTPCSGTTTTPITPSSSSSSSSSRVLPTSGRAADAALDRIDNKLLAVPADAVSRRLLRDGRAALRRSRISLPGSVSFAGDASSSSGRRVPSPAEGSSESAAGYPSEMNE